MIPILLVVGLVYVGLRMAGHNSASTPGVSNPSLGSWRVHGHNPNGGQSSDVGYDSENDARNYAKQVADSWGNSTDGMPKGAYVQVTNPSGVVVMHMGSLQ